MRSTDELLLVEVKSNGERVTFKDNDISIPTALSINGRIFVSPKDHLDALVSSVQLVIRRPPGGFKDQVPLRATNAINLNHSNRTLCS